MNAEEILEANLNPQVEEVPQEPVAQVVEETPAVPQFDPAQFQEQISSTIDSKFGGIQDTLNSIKAQEAQRNMPEPSEEEMIQAQILEKLGIKGLQEKLDAEAQEREALKQELEVLKQEQKQRALANEVDRLEKTYDGFNEELIIKELEELAQLNPEMANSLNNPQGWEYIWQKTYAGKMGKQPDPITPSETSGGELEENTTQRFAKGEQTQDDIANLLFSYSS